MVNKIYFLPLKCSKSGERAWSLYKTIWQELTVSLFLIPWHSPANSISLLVGTCPSAFISEIDVSTTWEALRTERHFLLWLLGGSTPNFWAWTIMMMATPWTLNTWSVTSKDMGTVGGQLASHDHCYGDNCVGSRRAVTVQTSVPIISALHLAKDLFGQFCVDLSEP